MTGLKRTVVILVLFYFIGSCTPQARYRTLSLFFDGVPDPAKQAEPDSTKNDSTSTVFATKMPGTKNTILWIVHEAYSDGSCADCHDKSLGNSLVEPLPDLCYQCHDDFSEKYEIVHAPVDDGNCTDCHNPHKSKSSSLLILPIERICFNCHDFEDIKENETHEDVSAGDCLDCHNPHGGEEFLL